MIVAAGYEVHNYWAAFLLTLASAGTFLHTGLKVPYFIWFGKNNCSKKTWQRAGDPPKNMQLAMFMAAALCIFVGCYTPYLYDMLPFPQAAAAYHPYTAYHVAETLQILLFTALGFFLLLKKLSPEPTISLDLDWFYRKGGRLFYWLARKPVQTADTAVGEAWNKEGIVPLMRTARFWSWFDWHVIDTVVDGTARGVRALGGKLRLVQRGRLQISITYMAVLMAFALAFLALA